MKLSIKTQLKGIQKAEVKQGFTEKLFLSLNPPFPPVDLLRFDGCSKGDQVSLRLNFIFFKQNWTSDIIEEHEDQDTWYFVDKGIKLPFFLKSWEHKHIVNSTSSGSEIVDAIEYTTGTLFTDLLFFPLLFGQFAYRIPIYKRYFRKLPQQNSATLTNK